MASIVVEVTKQCNNRCSHCYNFWRGDGSRKTFPPGLRRREISTLVGRVLQDILIDQIALSGGEPLLRPDLAGITNDLADMGLRVVVITNGTLLDESHLEQFPPGCTFEVTIFSADATLHDRIAGRPVFQPLLNNLARLDRRGFNLVLVCVVTSLNAHDVTRTIKLGIALGACAVMINRINISRNVFRRGKHLVPSLSQLREGLRAADEASSKYGITVLVSVPVPPCLADPKEYPHLHFGWCPRGGENAYYTIGCNGRLRPCNHSSVELGDLAKQKFAEIINSNKAKHFWEQVPDACEKCNHPLKDECRGGCPAAADECYGTRVRIDPFVELAQLAELGPPHVPLAR